MKTLSKRLALVASIPLALALFTLSSCQTVKTLNIENPNYRIRDIRPRVAVALPLSASTIDFDFLIDVENTNNVNLRLDRIDFDLFINDSKVISGISDQGIRIPAKGSGDVHLRTRVGYDNIRSIFREVLDVVQGQRARYQLKGKVYYDTPIGQMQFPLTLYSADVR